MAFNGPSAPVRPLNFEPNDGQFDPRVKFLARGKGFSAFVTQDELVLTLQPQRFWAPGRQPMDVSGGGRPAPRPRSARVRMALVGANTNAAVDGIDGLPGTSSYFIGSDPGKWRRNVPTYAKVKYQRVYPGVDLVYYGNQHELEYDFIVLPGADPKAIAFDVTPESEDTLAPTIDSRGDLIIPSSGLDVRFHKPFVYQQNDDGTRRPVNGGFVLRGKRRVGFEIGAYDRTRDLVIDPATYLGGHGDDAIAAMVHAGPGLYVAGTTNSDDFPGTATRDSSRTDSDAFVALLSADLTTVIHTTYIGGVSNDAATALAVSGSNVYVAGSTSSLDFAGLAGGAQPYNAGGTSDGFVVLLSADLTTLTQATCLGAIGSDSINAIAVPSTSLGGYSVFVAGSTNSKYFPKTTGGAEPVANLGVYVDNTNTTQGDGFAAVFSADLKVLTQATYLGGTERDSATAIAVPGTGGFVYIAGFTDSGGTTNANGFPHVLTGAQRDNGGGTDIFGLPTDGFVTLLTSDLTTMMNSTYLGGNGVDIPNAMAVQISAAGNEQVYVAGLTTSTDFPGTPSSSWNVGTGSAQHRAGGNTDGFVALLSSDLSVLQNASYLGGTGIDSANAIVVSGNYVYVGGRTTSSASGTNRFPAFPATLGGPQQDYAGGSGIGDGFIAQVRPDLSSFGQNTYLGGSFDDEVRVLALGRGRTIFQTMVYAAGETSSYNFPWTASGAQPGISYFTDGFVASLSLDADFLFGPIKAVPIMVSSAGNVVVTLSSVNGFEAVVQLRAKAPAGFAAVLSPPEIAIPAGGSASATLHLEPGLSITPGSFDLTLDAVSGPLSSSTPVHADVSVSTNGVAKVIDSLASAGCIDASGFANAVTGKLASAQALLDQGDLRTAAATYKGLLGDLDAQAGKHSGTSCTLNGITFSPYQTLVKDVTALSASSIAK